MVKKIPGELFDCTDKYIEPFEVVDVFNNDHILKGYICHKDGQYYGSMLITHINGMQTIDGGIVIYGTPKQKYPFDKNGIWRFPSTEKITIYDKIDGTNVLGFKYIFRGKEYVSYKLRLTPVVRNSRFGNFLDMWRKMLEKYPISERLKDHISYNFSFELYGNSNKHLIEYDVLLDIALLFIVNNQTGEIIDLDTANLCFSGIPQAKKEVSINKKTDLVSYYRKLQEEKEAKIQKLEDGSLKGSEGSVWYLHTIDDKVIQFKMKPESVEQIHWAKGLDKNIILATVMNCYENTDIVDFEAVKKLLLEEFSERTIEDSARLIDICIKEIDKRIKFEEEIVSFYKTHQLDIKEDKVGTMRAFSKEYPKDAMRKIFGILIKNL
ncbi:MAG: hypothetical protein ABIF11_08790 [Nitrospirota bacterium]